MIKKAILKVWYSGSYTATIQIAGSAKAYLTGIKVARNIPSAEMVTGRSLAVLFMDKNNPADAVVIAVYNS
jgi:hypothetical protein